MKLYPSLSLILAADMDEYSSREYKELVKMCKRARVPFEMKRDPSHPLKPWMAVLDTGALLYYEPDEEWKDDSVDPEPYFIFFEASEDSEGPYRFKASKMEGVPELKKLYETDKAKL